MIRPVNATSKMPRCSDLIAPSNARACAELLVSVGLVVASLVIPATTGQNPGIIAICIAIGAVGFVRTFCVLHDCAHESLFRTRWLNGVTGTLLGGLVHTPFYSWRQSHRLHHTTSGNLDGRGSGDIWTLTVDEYQDGSSLQRMAYRAYRNPVILFLVLGPLMFLVKWRVRCAQQPFSWDVVLTNSLVVGCYASVYSLFGAYVLLAVFVPSMVLACAIGSALFYLQHQFEGTYWNRRSDWKFLDSAVRGSSFLRVPGLVHYLFFNVTHHNVHHLYPQAPGYRLPEVRARLAGGAPGFGDDEPQLRINDIPKSLRLKLWDPATQRMVGWPA